MGIPAAPDVANLYMSYFEDSFANDFLLYKRYIDEVFCLVEAESKKAALEQCAKVHLDGLTLTLSVEEKAVNFLDLTTSAKSKLVPLLVLPNQDCRLPLSLTMSIPYLFRRTWTPLVLLAPLLATPGPPAPIPYCSPGPLLVPP